MEIMDNRNQSEISEIMSETRVNKCPKSFSIESLISRKSPAVEVTNAPMPSEAMLMAPSLGHPALGFPQNFPVAAAAAIYNPWIHSYLAQQQHPPPGAKYPGTFLDLPTEMSKHKLTEMFAVATDPRLFFGADPSHREKLLAQYFANNVRDKKFSDLFLSASGGEYYANGMAAASGFGLAQHFSGDPNFIAPSNDGRPDQCGDNVIDVDGSETNAEDCSSQNLRFARSHQAMGDDDGADELIDDELDSDCESELSMTMSPDAANRIQGM